MAHENRKKSLLKKHNLAGVNKPKRTPNHKTKSHMVLAQDGHKLKLIRFGQQGVSGAGKNPKTAKEKARKKSYYARHGQSSDKMSAKYWSHKTKW
jgi:hypothetical protein